MKGNKKKYSTQRWVVLRKKVVGSTSHREKIWDFYERYKAKSAGVKSLTW